MPPYIHSSVRSQQNPPIRTVTVDTTMSSKQYQASYAGTRELGTTSRMPGGFKSGSDAGSSILTAQFVLMMFRSRQQDVTIR